MCSLLFQVEIVQICEASSVPILAAFKHCLIVDFSQYFGLDSLVRVSLVVSFGRHLLPDIDSCVVRAWRLPFMDWSMQTCVLDIVNIADKLDGIPMLFHNLFDLLSFVPFRVPSQRIPQRCDPLSCRFVIIFQQFLQFNFFIFMKLLFFLLHLW